jgi:fumarate hydratase class II
MRLERDSLGEVEVPADRYYGAQTGRALVYFAIGRERMPLELVHALGLIKKAAALANLELGRLSRETAELIVRAAEDVAAGALDDHFPLGVWMAGAGTPANMNVNEVIANRASELAGGVLGARAPVHPNDHVNLSQSTNDVFPTAMHLASAREITARLMPALAGLREALRAKAADWAGIAKTGRTHMMDAVPLTLGQEFSGYAAMVGDGLGRLGAVMPGVYELALGGTAVGTGINAPRGFAEAAVARLARLTGLPFVPAPNRFAAQGAHDALVALSATLKTLAVSLYKIAGDIRLLASGPRCGLQELILPANEPGSSIMPGKVNPTQCEALAMVAVQVMGLDAAVSFAGAGGILEMNVYKPLIAHNLLTSIRLLADACGSFTEHCLAGMAPNLPQIAAALGRSLMLVTALSPLIGYDKAAAVARKAAAEGTTLRQAALALGYVSAAQFDRVVDPVKMATPED